MYPDNSKSFLAIDLGASSGRAMMGTVRNCQLELKEIKRFPNPIIEVNGRLYWDLFHLYGQIIAALQEVKSHRQLITSVGIDTWGVDFVCFGKDGEPLRMPGCYRDPRTFGAPERFFSKIPAEEVYRRTGIQIMHFNTLFQLDTLQREESSVCPVIDKILFMPDALACMLTGKMVTEYTIASTSQMMNPYTKEFDETLLKAAGLTADRFAPIVFPGSVTGKISPSVQRQTGLRDLSVVAVAGHDTASAVLATPAKDECFAYLSSGTWSLMGIESEKPVISDKSFAMNFTNEGGADGTVRLLKNICGMWLIEQCKREWDEDREPVTYEDIVAAAKQSTPFGSFINPDSQRFAAPPSMIAAIRDYCEETNQQIPRTMGQIARCIYESLAFRYRQVLADLQQLAPFPVHTLHIIGGGARNKLLNFFTANAIGKPVVAGPSEATAMGNILLQAKAAGMAGSKKEIRQIVRNSVFLELFEPEDTAPWDIHYNSYRNVYREQ
ncbi:MAG: rhamnulokinase [Proteiniphilum sp.]|jgi:rhamnulokinase|nr:rhamnulokinase [Proteiniphilum sp.]